MKKVCFILIFILAYFLSPAQNDDVCSDGPVAISAQLLSRYIWRGIDVGGNLPFLQPSIEVNFGNNQHNFCIELWGSYAIGKTFDEELDVFLTYTYNEVISLTFVDYFTYDNSPSGYDLFNYRNGETPHLLEGEIGFLGTEKLPISLLFSIMIYGDDARRINQDGTEGRIFYSKYAELCYEKTLGEMSMTIFMGAAFDRANIERNEETFYGNEKPGIVNLGCSFIKPVRISENYIPEIEISMITNPSLKTAFIVAGITF